MAYDKMRHHRRSIRWKKWNYAKQGAYFITICSRDREYLFGEIFDGVMVLSEIGQIVENTWLELTRRYSSIKLGEYQVMPNHFHALLFLDGETETPLGNVVKAFKSLAFHQYYTLLKERDSLTFKKAKIWQRNYWDHVVRDDEDLRNCRNYISNNPSNWQGDDENLNRLLARMTEHESP